MTDQIPDRDRERERLSDLLRAVVPDGPDPAGRADQVVRRGRHGTRRRGAVSVLAVGAVAFAVIAAPRLFTSSTHSTTATGRDTTVAAANLAHPFACATPGHPTAAATPHPSGQVPSGAVLARLCPLTGSGSGEWSAPGDALTSNVDAVAAVFNTLPSARVMSCPPPLGAHAFTVTFQYADGRLVRLSGQDDGCNYVRLTGSAGLGRAGADRVLHAFLTQLAAQRAMLSPPAASPVADLTCPTTLTGARPSILLDPRHLDLTSAVLCTYPKGLPGQSQRATLTDGQVQAVDRDWTAGASQAIPAIGCLGPTPKTAILGVDRWGDRVWLAWDCVTYNYGFDGSVILGWSPSPPVQRMLDRASGA